jgi:hypothetical protein
MLVDFFHFAANYIILLVVLRLLQARLADTQWGSALAFLG